MTERVKWIEMLSDVVASKIPDSPKLNSSEHVPNEKEIIQNNQQKYEKSEISSEPHWKSIEQTQNTETPIESPAGTLIEDVLQKNISLPTDRLREIPANKHISQSIEQRAEWRIERPTAKNVEITIDKHHQSLARQEAVQPIETRNRRSTRQLPIEPYENISPQPLHLNDRSILNNDSHPLSQHQIPLAFCLQTRPVNPVDKNIAGKRKSEARTYNRVLWDIQSDLLLRYLKEVKNFGWPKIGEYFASKSLSVVQYRWKVLKKGKLKDCHAMTTDIYSINIAAILRELGIDKELSEECIGKGTSGLVVQNKVTMNHVPWDLQTDLLLRYLKEVRNFTWKDISEYFIDRTPASCQTRWNTLKLGSEKEYHAVPMEIYSIDVKAILKNMGVTKKLPDPSDTVENTDTSETVNNNETNNGNEQLQPVDNLTAKTDTVNGSDKTLELVGESNIQKHLPIEEPFQFESPVARALPSNLIKARGKPVRSYTKEIISENRVSKEPSTKVRTSSKRRDVDELINNSPKKRKPSKYEEAEDEVYGILEKPNIKQVQFGLDKLFPTWYGSAVYFEKTKRKLGIYSSKDRHSTSSDYNKVDISPSKYKKTSHMMDVEDESNHKLGNIENRKNDHEKSSDDDSKEREDDSIWLDTLYVCEYCFKYTTNPESLKMHVSLCKYKLRKPPGKIKYRSPEYTIRRVKGYKEKLFCQCLCLFTKLFLDNKSIYFKVENYDFFILYKTGGHKPMAFFSRDITSFNQNNLACILTLPPYQRKGLGSLLIEFSYKLSRSEGLISGPELPLSPFGLIGYINHWGKTICFHIFDGELSHLLSVSIKDISLVTGFRIEDIIMTLNYLECLDEKTGIINTNQLFVWLRSRKKKNEDFMLKDEYLMISD